MFPYTDPGKTLKPAKALANYRMRLHVEYVQSARLPGSAFTLLEAFHEIVPAKTAVAAVEWAAFPRSAQATNAEIDGNRFQLQDEYVEWRVERAGGQIQQITFTTDFLAYYEALARIGINELAVAIKAVIPKANPTAAELFGPGFSPATASEEARARRFREFSQQNPWNNGERGILSLAHRNNSLEALFRLVDIAAVPNPQVDPGSICGTLHGNCVPGRNSDPSIATAVQTLARGSRSLSLVDPVGIQIARLAGVWRVKNQEIDVNEPDSNEGVWAVTRTGRRGVLKVVQGLLLDDTPITSGAQVAAALRVKAAVVSAADDDLPEWARLGQEGSQRLADMAEGGQS